MKSNSTGAESKKLHEIYATFRRIPTVNLECDEGLTLLCR